MNDWIIENLDSWLRYGVCNSDNARDHLMNGGWIAYLSLLSFIHWTLWLPAIALALYNPIIEYKEHRGQWIRAIKWLFTRKGMSAEELSTRIDSGAVDGVADMFWKLFDSLRGLGLGIIAHVIVWHLKN